MPEELIVHYSKRRRAVEAQARARIAESEHILGRGLTLQERRRTYERAVLGTRHAKDHSEVSDEGLHDRWHADADATGFTPETWLGEVVDRHGAHQEVNVEAVVAQSLAELATSSSTWGRRHVVQQVARRAPGGLEGAEEARRWVEDVADRVLADAQVIRLVPPASEPPQDLRRRDGRSVYEAHGAARYSTLATLAREQHVLDLVLAGRQAGRGLASASATELAIAEAALGEDQAAAVRQMCLGGEALSVLVGPAGAGKSHTMGAAAQAWEASGIPVRGLAVSAAAAGVLEFEAGIASETIAKLVSEHDRPEGPSEAWRIRRGEVVVVDEAAMVSSADLARVVTLAAEAEAKVVLVGDHRQLGAVEAGGLFRLLAGETKAAELSGVRRFHAEWERDASLGLRGGDRTVVEEYYQRGRVVGGERAVMVDEAFERWQWSRTRGDSVVVCAADHASVDELAARSRAARVAAGEVEAEGVAAGNHVVGVGDEIVTTRNDRRLVTSGGGWVRNGDRWEVLARHGDDALVVQDVSGRGRVTLPGDYVRDEVALAYALTIHKAQGLTVDCSILLVDERTTAEGLYVGMTRGRSSNVALAICDDDTTEHARPGPARSEVEVLLATMGRSSAEVAALEALREAFARSESLATLGPRLANLTAQLARETPPDRSGELDRAKLALERARQHCRPGHLTRNGREDRRHLEAVEARYEEMSAEVERRQAWLANHAETFAYRDQLKEMVAERRHELGFRAAITQPAHVVDIIGSVPTESPEATRRWIKSAARIEAYREEWAVAPEMLRERPWDACQEQAWDVAVRTTELLARPPTPLVERRIDHGMELGL